MAFTCSGGRPLLIGSKSVPVLCYFSIAVLCRCSGLFGASSTFRHDERRSGPAQENLNYANDQTAISLVNHGSLRTNFQQLGDADALNKAMRVELSATEIHLKKAWQSNESYYRSHHPGVLSRTLAFLEWLKFKVLDFIWGNGENLFRLVRFVLIVLVLMALGDVAVYGDPGRVQSYGASFIRSFAIFFGTLIPDDYGKAYLALITCVRLVIVGFFLSIIIKKFSRR
jgi:hypothetical protein